MSLYEPIFKALNQSGIRYVVVGGLAVVLHGHARFTADLDLIVDLEPAAAQQAIGALVDLGLRRSVLTGLQSSSVRIASLPDLIELKRQAGRPQDLADIEKLRQIERLRQERS